MNHQKVVVCDSKGYSYSHHPHTRNHRKHRTTKEMQVVVSDVRGEAFTAKAVSEYW